MNSIVYISNLLIRRTNMANVFPDGVNRLNDLEKKFVFILIERVILILDTNSEMAPFPKTPVKFLD